MGYRWTVVRCEPNRETTGAAGLVGNGLQAYFPQISKRERHGRGAIRTQLRPMFCGYVFVFSAPSDPLWARLYNLPGLRGPLMLGGTLATISQTEFDLVKNTETQLLNLPASRGHDFKVGETVRLKDDSPFAGQLTTIADLDDEGRITVLMSLFSRQVPKVVKSDQIERV